MIVLTSLLLADRRLYEAAESLGTTRRRQFLHHHAAFRALRAGERRDGRLLVHGQRFRHSEGHRRQLPRARDRHLPAGHRTAELQPRRGRDLVLLLPVLLALASTGGCAGGRSAILRRAVPYARARAGLRPRDARLLHADRVFILACWAWRSTRRLSSCGRTTSRSACGTTRTA